MTTADPRSSHPLVCADGPASGFNRSHGTSLNSWEKVDPRTVEDGFSEGEKNLARQSEPSPIALPTAVGLFRDALRQGGYQLDETADTLPVALHAPCCAVALAHCVASAPCLAPLLTPARQAAYQAAMALLSEISAGHWLMPAATPPESAPEKLTSKNNNQPTNTTMIEMLRESPLAALNAYSAERDPRKRSAIYQNDIAARMSEIESVPLSAANSPGTLAGTLVTQRTLELLKIQFPILRRIATDFSTEPVKYNAQIISRIVSIPTVGTYNTTTGYAQSDQTSIDVPVTINRHKFVQITFGANSLSGTVRQLFKEFAPASAYALAKEMVDYIYGLILAASYTNSTVCGLADFSRQTVIDLGTALNLRGVPQGAMNRTLLLYSTYFGKLAADPAIVSLAAFQKSEIITDGALPNVHGFAVMDAPNLPGNAENLVGVGLNQSALVLATRLPGDYANALPGASNGIVDVVLDPDLEMAVQQVQYVDHTLGTANLRMAIQYGAAVGQADAAQRLTSA